MVPGRYIIHIKLFSIVFIYLTKSVETTENSLMLSRPFDISYECWREQMLEFDLTFGMGLSDTITVQLKNILNVDSYSCTISFSSTPNSYLLIVLQYPNSYITNCKYNNDAFFYLDVEANISIPVCHMQWRYFTADKYFLVITENVSHFAFNNMAISNHIMGVSSYQLTVTTARKISNCSTLDPSDACYVVPQCIKENETLCSMLGDTYCFTIHTLCDGIKNCGRPEWFDERRALCYEPRPSLSNISVLTVLCALAFVGLAIVHMADRLMPHKPKAFFLLNADEDNRFNIRPHHWKQQDPIATSAYQISEATMSNTQKMRPTNLRIITRLKKAIRAFREDCPESPALPPE